ncbi:MAG TPA: hypothetical protein VI341_02540 [Actinomycetota bacterium]
MNDLKPLFERDLARVPMPALWADIETRTAAPEAPERDTRLQPTPPRRRLAPLLLAAAVTTALFAGLFSVIRDEPAPPAEEPVPNVLRITCLGGQMERLSSRTVAVQPDGLHVEIIQRFPGEPIMVGWRDTDMGYGYQSIRLSSHAGPRQEVVSTMHISVGDLGIGCFETRPGAFSASDFEWVKVVDPGGVWVSTVLDCELVVGRGSIGSEYTDLDGVPEGEWPQRLLDRTRGLVRGDVVEPAGFPDAELPSFRAVRDGRVIARYQVGRDADGGLYAEMDACGIRSE